MSADDKQPSVKRERVAVLLPVDPPLRMEDHRVPRPETKRVWSNNKAFCSDEGAIDYLLDFLMEPQLQRQLLKSETPGLTTTRG